MTANRPFCLPPLFTTPLVDDSIFMDSFISLSIIFTFLSVLFTMTFSYLSSPPSVKPKRLRAPPRYLAEFKAARAQREERQRRERQTIKPIPFITLPGELKLKILSHGSLPGSIDMFRALLQVTKEIRYITLQSCLPVLPIILDSRAKILSFYAFCLDNHDLTRSVHHIWVSPPSQEDEYPASVIIKTCTNLRWLACPATLLGTSVCAETKLKHDDCQRYTLLSSKGDWESRLPKRVGNAFFSRLTHLCVTCEKIPRTFGCRKVTHLSRVYGGEKFDGYLTEVLEDVKLFPRLKGLLVRQEEQWTGVESVDDGWRQYTIPSNVSDLDLWIDGVRGKSFWERG